MNARRHHAPWPPDTFTRITTPSGTRASVVHALWQRNGGWGPRHAAYRVPGATVYGPFPPTPELLRELGRWA